MRGLVPHNFSICIRGEGNTKRYLINFFCGYNLWKIHLDSFFNYEPFRHSGDLCAQASVLYDKNL